MERRENLIGVYGGTFDPIHEGHIYLLQSLLKTGLFEKILLVPAKQNPLKKSRSKVPDDLRLKMLRTSLSELADSRIEIWDGELKRDGLSYMKDTLIELSKIHPGRLTLIMGNEVFSEFDKWKEPKTILNLANLAIIQRTGESINIEAVLKSCGIIPPKAVENGVNFSDTSRWIKVFKINALPFSATEIRANLAKAWKSGDLAQTPHGIQRSVWLLIKENQLYAVN